MRFDVLHGDNLVTLKAMESNQFDAVVTDPPYGLGREPDALAMLADWMNEGHHAHTSAGGFMGREWDAFVPQPRLWREVFRVLKPGGHLLSFAGAWRNPLTIGAVMMCVLCAGSCGRRLRPARTR